MRLKSLAEQYPRYGYPTLHGLLKAEGLVQNRKRTYRLYREEGLQVRTKRRKKFVRPRVPMPVPGAVNERWSIEEICKDRLPQWGRPSQPVTSVLSAHGLSLGSQ